MRTIALATFIMVSCKMLFNGSAPPQQLTRPNGSQHYELVKLKRKNSTLPPIVQGKLTGEIDFIPLRIGIVKVERTTLPADSTGAYLWQGDPGIYIFKAGSVGYDEVVSERIRLTEGDSIRLDFHLPIGPPIIHKM